MGGPARPMRIAIDIDSTLHHYWGELERAAHERYGVSVPYADQHTWTIPELDKSQLKHVIADTHADDAIARATPYPLAVETVNAWHDAGHWIHITSHRARTAGPATARWLDDIGLHHDDLHCSYDKLSRCRELDVDLLIDDSPDTLASALEAGIAVATLVHPWNRELCAREPRIVSADDWRGLAQALDERFALTRRAA